MPDLLSGGSGFGGLGYNNRLSQTETQESAFVEAVNVIG
jgi:hypothetical protein